jgi:hypothetical protein
MEKFQLLFSRDNSIHLAKAGRPIQAARKAAEVSTVFHINLAKNTVG